MRWSVALVVGESVIARSITGGQKIILCCLLGYAPDLKHAPDFLLCPQHSILKGD